MDTSDSALYVWCLLVELLISLRHVSFNIFVEGKTSNKNKSRYSPELYLLLT